MEDNEIEGFKFLHGGEELLKLNNLEYLDLSVNHFDNNVLLFLKKLSSLKTLLISYNQLKGILNIEEFNCLISLQELRIQGNEIQGFKSLHGGEELLKLNNLEFLDLSVNHFDNNVFSFLKGLLSLKTLKIRHNQLEGSFKLKELDAWSKLQELDLSGNGIDEFVSSTTDFGGPSNMSILYLEEINTSGRSNLIQSLKAFPHLKTLYLTNNNFTDDIFAEGFPILRNLQHLHLDLSTLNNSFLQSIGTLTSLKTLSLTQCGLTGTIPSTQGLCELKHLKDLDISFNSLSGNLPWCLANLTSLQRLDISSNSFNGSISSSPLSSLTSINHLSLSYNKFQIPISLNPFVSLSNLTSFDCVGCEIYAETEVDDMTPNF
eukprot:XP_015582776.1 receptor-like protein 13 isoform X1 [Ricinus communis]